MPKTQHRKIIEMCEDGAWHCNHEFRMRCQSFSPHKRRKEIEEGLPRQGIPAGKYRFEERKCQHGVANQKDYKLVENAPKEVTNYYSQGQLVHQAKIW